VRRLSRRAPPTLQYSDADGLLTLGKYSPRSFGQGAAGSRSFGQGAAAVLGRSFGRVPRVFGRRRLLSPGDDARGPPLLPPVRAFAPTGEREETRGLLPPELAHLLDLSALCSDVQTVQKLNEIVDPLCRRFLLGVEEDSSPLPEVTLDVSGNPYSVSPATKKELFRLTDPKELSLPPPPPAGARRVKVQDFITDRTNEHLDASFPFHLLFTEENLERCRLTAEEMPARTGSHTSLNLAPGVTKVELAKCLMARGVADMFSEDAPGMRTTEAAGCFTLLKSEVPTVKTRFVFDGVNENRPYSMAKLQLIYLEILAAHPVLAQRLELSDKLMDIPDPHGVTDMPEGAVCVSSGDYSDYFYQILTYLWLISSQAFGWFDGADFGRPGERLRLAMVVCAMGNWLSALIAHVLHRSFLNRVFVQREEALRALPEEWASPEHRQDLAIVRATAARSPDGLVAWTDVPLRMRHKASRMLRKDGRRDPADAELGLREHLRVPVDALTLEPLPPGVSGLPGAPAVRMKTTLLGGRKDARARVRKARGDDDDPAELVFVNLAVVYQDDCDVYTFPSKRLGTAEGVRLGLQAGSLLRLLIILAADVVGLRQNFGKLKFAGNGKHVTLGVGVDFVSAHLMRFAVRAVKRRRLASALHLIISSGARCVEVEYFESLLGDAVWCLLCRRPLLSVLRLAYKALHKAKRKGAVRLLLFDGLRLELFLLAAVLPLAEERSRSFADVLYTFDASGASKKGAGGYGVATRIGLSEAVATELCTVVEPGTGNLPVFKVGPDFEVPMTRQENPAHADIAREATDFLKFDWESSKPEWEAPIFGSFKVSPRIINLGECYAGAKAFQHDAQRPDSRGKLLPLGGDNRTAQHCFQNGRSSVGDMNQVMRTTAVRSVIYDVRGAWFWLPSEANSSDGPSRWCRRPRGREARMWAGEGGRPPVWMTSGEAKKPGPPRTPWHPYKGVKPTIAQVLNAPLALFTLKYDVDTARVYLQAIDGFFAYLSDHPGQHFTVEGALVGFIFELYQTRKAPKQTAIVLLAAIGKFHPKLAISGDLKLPQLALQGWRKMHSGISWLPVPYVLNLLFAVLLLSTGDEHKIDVAITALIAFHVYSRGGEMEDLNVEDVMMPGDPHNLAPSTGALCFVKPKAKKPQTVRMDDPFCIQLTAVQLQRVAARPRRSSRRGGTPLFDFGPNGFLRIYQQAQMWAGYAHPPFVRHSVRHGGATDDYAKHVPGQFPLMGRTVLDISVRMRHKNATTTLVYLQDAQAQLQMALRPDVALRMISQFGGVDGMLGIVRGILRMPAL
jgi:hypothetical protein